MKKILAFACALVMLLSLVACSEQKTPDHGQSGSTEAVDDVGELNYPESKIDLLVGFKAGGGTYLSAQMLTYYNDIFGTEINLIDKAGSGGAIAADYVANAAGDGYTALYCTASLPISIGMGDVEFKTEDLIPVAQVSEVCQVIAVAADAPYDNMTELAAYLEENPGDFNWAYPGTGSSLHIMGTYVMKSAGLFDKSNGIPYEATSEAIAAILGGHIDAVSMYTTSIGDYVAAGQLKILGILADERNADFDYIPTYLEQGIDIESITVWRGVFVPGDTPQAIVDYLSEKIGEICAKDDFAQRAKDLGESVAYMSHSDFSQKYKSEVEKYADLLEEYGLKEG